MTVRKRSSTRTNNRSGRSRGKRTGTRTKARSSGYKKYGTRYYKIATDDCNTLFIVKDDSSRSTRTCAEDTAYEFRKDFDKTVIATSDRQAKDGDIVAIVDSDVDCEHLWLVTIEHVLYCLTVTFISSFYQSSI
jgi:hypothetical protein